MKINVIRRFYKPFSNHCGYYPQHSWTNEKYTCKVPAGMASLMPVSYSKPAVALKIPWSVSSLSHTVAFIGSCEEGPRRVSNVRTRRVKDVRNHKTSCFTSLVHVPVSYVLRACIRMVMKATYEKKAKLLMWKLVSKIKFCQRNTFNN